MTEASETKALADVNSLLDRAPKAIDGPKPAANQAEAQEARLNLQLQVHNERDRNQSVLGTLVGSVYGGEKQSKEQLQQLAEDMQKAKREGNVQQYNADVARVDQVVNDDKSALWTADTITGVGTGALKAGGLFMAIAATRGRALMAAGAGTFALYGLDQAKAQDNFSTQAFDFALGGTKGVATAATFRALAPVEINPLGRGVIFGTTSRFIDLGLSRETYRDQASGNNFDLVGGVERTVAGTFTAKSMITDAALFGVSSKMTSGLGKIAGPELASSPLFRTMSTSSMFGLSSGMHSEFVRQERYGESLDIGKVLTRGLLQAAADGLAGAPAGKYSASLAESKFDATPRLPPETSPALMSEKVQTAAPEVTRPTRAADTTLADGTRIIEKPNGTRVTIYANGDRTLEEPGAPKITFKTDGRVQREGPDGKIIETRSKANTPLDERPLNVASGAFESIGKQLSNFARRPFVMDGQRYESVEAFYQGLKWSDPAQRAEIAKLYGPEAKSAGRGSKATEFEYEGQTIKFRSPEHYALMKRAITASLEQNPEILKEFQATHPRPIEHKTGRRENPNSGYPASVFTTTLNEVRAETLAKAGQSDVKPTATSGSSVEMTNNNPSKAVPISELLKSITNNGGNHNLQLYADAFKNSEFQASSVVASGGDALVLRLADGNIMKLTTRTSSRPQEPFDMPVLSSGVREVDGRAVKYFIQPEAKPATMSDLADFLKVLTHHGYRMTDPGVAQIGIYEGQIKLLDPYAVDRN